MTPKHKKNVFNGKHFLNKKNSIALKKILIKLSVFFGLIRKKVKLLNRQRLNSFKIMLILALSR